MSPFTGALITRYLPATGKHLVCKRFVYTHHEYGRITITRGFLTDFDSVPRLPLAYWLLKNRAKMAPVVHDWLYFNGAIRGEPIERATADRVFLDAMREEGVRWWRRRLIWLGVRAGGWRPWGRYRKRDAEERPSV